MSPFVVSSFTLNSAGAVRFTAGALGSERTLLSCARRSDAATMTTIRTKGVYPTEKKKGAGIAPCALWKARSRLLAVVALDRPEPDVAVPRRVPVVLEADG